MGGSGACPLVGGALSLGEIRGAVCLGALMVASLLMGGVVSHVVCCLALSPVVQGQSFPK